MAQGPLNGVKILEFNGIGPGPFCGMLLSDMGARVVKVESPGRGDYARGWGPPFAGDQSSFFLGLNRGKFGISIDLKKPEGVALCRRLAERMDVVIENFRPGTMERLGLGYQAVRAKNPGLIYCSISGYGQDGPSKNEAAMDLVVDGDGSPVTQVSRPCKFCQMMLASPSGLLSGMTWLTVKLVV